MSYSTGWFKVEKGVYSSRDFDAVYCRKRKCWRLECNKTGHVYGKRYPNVQEAMIGAQRRRQSIASA